MDIQLLIIRVVYHIKSIRSYRDHKADIVIVIEMTDEPILLTSDGPIIS